MTSSSAWFSSASRALGTALARQYTALSKLDPQGEPFAQLLQHTAAAAGFVSHAPIRKLAQSLAHAHHVARTRALLDNPRVRSALIDAVVLLEQRFSSHDLEAAEDWPLNRARNQLSLLTEQAPEPDFDRLAWVAQRDYALPSQNQLVELASRLAPIETVLDAVLTDQPIEQTLAEALSTIELFGPVFVDYANVISALGLALEDAEGALLPRYALAQLVPNLRQWTTADDEDQLIVVLKGLALAQSACRQLPDHPAIKDYATSVGLPLRAKADIGFTHQALAESLSSVHTAAFDAFSNGDIEATQTWLNAMSQALDVANLDAARAETVQILNLLRRDDLSRETILSQLIQLPRGWNHLTSASERNQSGQYWLDSGLNEPMPTALVKETFTAAMTSAEGVMFAASKGFENGLKQQSLVLIRASAASVKQVAHVLGFLGGRLLSRSVMQLAEDISAIDRLGFEPDIWIERLAAANFLIQSLDEPKAVEHWSIRLRRLREQWQAALQPALATDEHASEQESSDRSMASESTEDAAVAAESEDAAPRVDAADSDVAEMPVDELSPVPSVRDGSPLPSAIEAQNEPVEAIENLEETSQSAWLPPGEDEPSDDPDLAHNWENPQALDEAQLDQVLDTLSRVYQHLDGWISDCRPALGVSVESLRRFALEQRIVPLEALLSALQVKMLQLRGDTVSARQQFADEAILDVAAMVPELVDQYLSHQHIELANQASVDELIALIEGWHYSVLSVKSQKPADSKIEPIQVIEPDVEPTVSDTFVEEVSGYLSAVQSILDDGFAPAQRDDVLRHLHTLKGACGAMGLPALHELAHAMETRVDQTPLPPSAEHLSKLLEMSEALMFNIEQYERGGELAKFEWLLDTPATDAESETSKSASLTPGENTSLQSIKLNRSDFGRLSTHFKQALNQWRYAYDNVQQLDQTLQAMTRLSREIADPAIEQRWRRQLNDLQSQLTQTHQWLRQRRRADQVMHHWVQQKQHITLDQLRGRLERQVALLAKAADREVKIKLENPHQTLDKRLVDSLMPAIEHLLNNAISHGIESSKVRRSMGKPDHGTITVAAVEQGNVFELSVEDDGAGVDFQAVRRRAEALGLDTSGNDQSLTPYLFLPGFSSSEPVDRYKGRGVGLDAVEQFVEEENGRVELSTRPGRGTRVRLLCKQAIARIRAVVVDIGAERFAVAERQLVKTLDGPVQGDVIRYQGERYQVVNLAAQLGLAAADKPKYVLAADGPHLRALMVDRVGPSQEVWAHSEVPLIDQLHLYSGIAQTDDGAMPLLSISGLKQRAEQVAQLVQGGILVVEPTVTGAKLAKRLLSPVFGRVQIVRGAHEAKSAWQQRRYDAVLIDMDIEGEDAIELAKSYAHEHPESRAPLALMTLHQFALREAHARDHGLAVLRKPLDLQEVSTLLR
ncbi:MAG: Hpt domain-containing protein [Gammaproteobacteria bacterium]|nr:Hpt domain-containing protein [Gammaproteobacteria bacterium]